MQLTHMLLLLAVLPASWLALAAPIPIRHIVIASADEQHVPTAGPVDFHVTHSTPEQPDQEVVLEVRMSGPGKMPDLAEEATKLGKLADNNLATSSGLSDWLPASLRGSTSSSERLVPMQSLRSDSGTGSFNGGVQDLNNNYVALHSQGSRNQMRGYDGLTQSMIDAKTTSKVRKKLERSLQVSPELRYPTSPQSPPRISPRPFDAPSKPPRPTWPAARDPFTIQHSPSNPITRVESSASVSSNANLLATTTEKSVFVSKKGKGKVSKALKAEWKAARAKEIQVQLIREDNEKLAAAQAEKEAKLEELAREKTASKQKRIESPKVEPTAEQLWEGELREVAVHGPRHRLYYGLSQGDLELVQKYKAEYQELQRLIRKGTRSNEIKTHMNRFKQGIKNGDIKFEKGFK